MNLSYVRLKRERNAALQNVHGLVAQLKEQRLEIREKDKRIIELEREISQQKEVIKCHTSD